MRISEFIKKLKSIFSFLIPNSAIPACRQAGALRIRHFSMGQQKVLFVLALLILALIYYKFYSHPQSSPEEVYDEIAVEVLGEVQKPGIYIFINPPTLKQAIEKAGGLRQPALFQTGTSSETLATGTLISVQKESSKIPPHPPFLKGGQEGLPKEDRGGINQEVIKIKLARMEARKLLVFSIPLDLNRVSVEDLCLIPGIGESLAREIVTYRESRKGFRSVEELKNVKGIGEKKWKDFRPFFTLEP